MCVCVCVRERLHRLSIPHESECVSVCVFAESVPQCLSASVRGYRQSRRRAVSAQLYGLSSYSFSVSPNLRQSRATHARWYAHAHTDSDPHAPLTRMHTLGTVHVTHNDTRAHTATAHWRNGPTHSRAHNVALPHAPCPYTYSPRTRRTHTHTYTAAQ